MTIVLAFDSPNSFYYDDFDYYIIFNSSNLSKKEVGVLGNKLREQDRTINVTKTNIIFKTQSIMQCVGYYFIHRHSKDPIKSLQRAWGSEVCNKKL